MNRSASLHHLPVAPLQDGESLAAIDLGSNSFHMVVARNVLGQLRVIDRLRETVRLADGLDGKGGLNDAAQERALDCLSRFGQRIRDLPPHRVRAIATNTVRALRDPQAFLSSAESALGHGIEVVSGREEARLIYLGVAHAQPPKPQQRRLVIDISAAPPHASSVPASTPSNAKACRSAASPAPGVSFPTANSRENAGRKR